LLSSVITALARTSAYPGTTATFARTVDSSLTPSKTEEGRRVEGLEETCLTLRSQVVTTARRRRGRSRAKGPWTTPEGILETSEGLPPPPDCTWTETNENITAYRVTDTRRTCRRVSLLTRMRDVNGAADETISCWSRANRSGTHGVSGAMYLQSHTQRGLYSFSKTQMLALRPTQSIICSLTGK